MRPTNPTPQEASSRGMLVRTLLRERHFGVLATMSRVVPDHPFGSVLPYALDSLGRPMVLISTIAQHTQNIQGDPRVSLTVWEAETGPDPQAFGRITWIGEAKPVEGDLDAAKERFLRYLPSSASHFDMHDFVLYRIDLTRLRYIGGFAKIFWIEPENVLLESPFAAEESGILDHVNQDHADGLARLLETRTGTKPQSSVMVACNQEGFDVLADGYRYFFPFIDRAEDLESIRREVIRIFHGKSVPS